MEMPIVVSVDEMASGLIPWEPSKLLAKLKRLNDLMCCPTWSNGPPKGERMLLVVAKDLEVYAMVKVANPELKLSCSGPTVDESLAGLELQLGLPTVPWQRQPAAKTPTKKSKK